MHHFLIGIPASGKSTFAQHLAQLIPNSVIISTDAIRKQLYGDEIIQGQWPEIEKHLFQKVEETLANQQTIIYDATNAQRHYRLSWLQQFNQSYKNHHWVAWWLDTPVDLCKIRNQQRSRYVPPMVIDRMIQGLQDYPPSLSEGFETIIKVPYFVEFEQPQQFCQWIKQQLQVIL